MDTKKLKRKAEYYWKKSKPSMKVFGNATWTLSKLFIVVAIAVSIGAGAVAAGIVIGAIHDLPEFDISILERPNLPSYIYDRNGVLITEIHDGENRIPITFDQVPEHLLYAFLAAEDANFFEHPGFDLRAIFRAAVTGYGGGSTITQQLTKQVFLTRQQTLRRKLQEVYIAIKVERQYVKEEIFEFYINLATFYGRSAQGVEAAAQTYFGKSVGELTLAESALLAGIPNWPAGYAPKAENLEPALARRKDVLWRMMSFGFITREEYDAANEEPITLVSQTGHNWAFPHYIDSVVAYFAIDALMSTGDYDTEAEAANAIRRGGLHIYTAMDIGIQQQLQDLIFNPANRPTLVTHTENSGRKSPQVGSVVMDAKTGYVYGMVGGWEYLPGVNTYNRAHLAYRQPGSSIKPVMVYGPAFQAGLMGTGTILDDKPTVYPNTATTEWTPENVTGTFKGLLTVREALVFSDNLPAIEAFSRVGGRNAANFAAKLINPVRENEWRTAEQTLGSAIGGAAWGVSPLQMARAYTAFANKGVVSDPIFIVRITDRHGTEIYNVRNDPSIKQEVVVSEEAAWMITDILREVVTRGTGRPSNIPANLNVAVKTGTTDAYQDRWVVGYSSDYVFSIWMGNDKKVFTDSKGVQQDTPSLRGDTHAKLHLIFGSMVRNIIGDKPVPLHPKPSNVIQVAVCNKSGLLPGPHCTTVVNEYYLRGTEPREECNLHITVQVCKEHGQLAGEYCPADSIIEKVFLNRPPFIETDERWSRGVGRKPADSVLMPPTEECTVHGPSYILNPSPLDTGVKLTWNNPRLTETNTGYNLYRKPYWSSEFEKVNTELIPIQTTEFNDNFLVPRGLSIQYKLMVVNEEGTERSLHPAVSYIRPLNAGLTASYDSEQQTVSLSWNRITFEDTTVTYNIWRNGSRLPAGQGIAGNGNGTVTWTDVTIKDAPAGTYEYQVSVVYTTGQGVNAKSIEAVKSALRPEATITKEAVVDDDDDDDDENGENGDGAGLPSWWAQLRSLISFF